MTIPDEPVAARRKRGTSAGLDSVRIVEAARAFDPQSLTMQAVADRLGVDRKALHFHVKDKDSLLELIATDAFASRFGSSRLSPGSDWQTACREFARNMNDALASCGLLVLHLRPQAQADARVLVPADEIFERLTAAGFDETFAARSVTLIANTTINFARDVVITAPGGEHPQTTEVRVALDAIESAQFSALRHAAALGVNTSDEAQFDFDIDLLLAGMKALSPQSP